jgi:hypothetical protein
MRRIAPAGTAYLPVQCTDIPTLQHTRCRKMSRQRAELPQQVLPTYLYTVQCTPYSLTYQMPHKCHRNTPAGTAYLFVQCSDITAPSLNRCPNRVTAMCRIVVAGLYTYFRPRRSPTRCRTSAQNYPSTYWEPICKAPPLTRTRNRGTVPVDTDIYRKYIRTYLLPTHGVNRYE